MLGSLRAMVENVERELKYYKDTVDEQRKVIEQIHRGYASPGEPTLIHPADFAEILQKHIASTNMLFTVNNCYEAKLPENNLINIRGTIYKQSPWMPKITKNF